MEFVVPVLSWLMENQNFSCRLKLKDVENCNIITIEGITLPDGTLHPVQQAFIDAGAIQCGFCTPGMVLTAYALLNKIPIQPGKK